MTEAAGLWIRVDVLRRKHARNLSAGAWGHIVIEAAWEICKAFGKSGILSDAEWKDTYLAEWMLFDRERSKSTWLRHIRRGMKACENTGMIRQVSGGGYEIRNWEKYQWDKTGAARQKRYREKQKQLSLDTDPSRNGDVDNVTGDGVTVHTNIQTDRQKRGKRPPIILDEALQTYIGWDTVDLDKWRGAYRDEFGALVDSFPWERGIKQVALFHGTLDRPPGNIRNAIRNGLRVELGKYRDGRQPYADDADGLPAWAKEL